MTAIQLKKAAKNFCSQYDEWCNGCKLKSGNVQNACPVRMISWGSEMADAISTLLFYAESHPEPKYPTWMDWLDKTFPERLKQFVCPSSFCGIEDHCRDFDYECKQCLSQSIPEDIAIKLGIDPLEE